MRLIDADALKERMKGTMRYFDIVADIDAAPTIEPKKGKWIPCSESLPKTSEQVLIVLKHAEDDFEVSIGEYWGDATDENEQGWGILFNDKVIAWQPLPEPYRGGEE